MKKKYRYRFLEIYRQSKKDFIKPKFHFFFGKWRNEHNLPVWRRGNLIHFGSYGERTEEWDYGRLVKSEWNELGKKNHPILSKIVKPLYMLPIWLSFYWFNSDIVYKTKWEDDDFRYEFPAHFTIVFFGLCFSITAYIPKQYDKDYTVNDDYWESMLTYQYYNGDLQKTDNVLGYYQKDELGVRFVFRPYFLKDKNKQIELVKIHNKFLEENGFKERELIDNWESEIKN